jgi:hypothetical protein
MRSSLFKKRTGEDGLVGLTVGIFTIRPNGEAELCSSKRHYRGKILQTPENRFFLKSEEGTFRITCKGKTDRVYLAIDNGLAIQEKNLSKYNKDQMGITEEGYS